MQCSTSSTLQINSFAVRAAGTITAISLARDQMTLRLEHEPVSVSKRKALLAQAKSVLAKTDKARTLWDAARFACKADGKGNCANKDAQNKAFALLAQAQEALK